MKCVIMAGGFGTRLHSLIQDRAKPLLEIKGKPLITHIIEKVPGDIEVIVSTNRKYEGQFMSWKKALARDVALFVERAQSEAEKPGAVSALNMLVQQKGLDEDLLVIGGDNYFEFDLDNFISCYDNRRTLLAVYDVGNRQKARNFGVVRLHGKQVIAFAEKPAVPGSTLVSTACYIFPPSIFPILNRFCREGRRDNLGGFISHLLLGNEVLAYTFKEKWSDIGSIQAYVDANSTEESRTVEFGYK